MTLTSRSMEWLDQNRHRSYPMRREAWRDKVSPESGLDCVLLDAMVFDADARGDERLRIVSIGVMADDGSSESDSSSWDERVNGHTMVEMEYAGRTFSVTLSGGTSSGANSFSLFRGWVPGHGERMASISLAFSSHRYILDTVGEGTWNIGCDLLGSRTASLSGGIGVDAMSVGGSEGVDGHETSAEASGDIVLEDGFRTSPIIWNGKVLVRVGKRYGHDPCQFDFGELGSADCRRPLFFFCGQNAINGGNVVIKGGKGISVSQGRNYKVRSGTCAGMSVPCIEIVAGRELVDMCKAGAVSS